nr:MAG TPA: hypothetical protein [Caudoviricetes sp.]
MQPRARCCPEVAFVFRCIVVLTSPDVFFIFVIVIKKINHYRKL